jgi:tetratricopeptide (TPR) repeat protein
VAFGPLSGPLHLRDLVPGDYGAHHTRGYALFFRGRIDESLAASERVIALVPGSGEADILRCRALFELGHIDEALAATDRAIALEQNGEAYFIRGDVLFALQRIEEAKRLMRLPVIEVSMDYCRSSDCQLLRQTNLQFLKVKTQIIVATILHPKLRIFSSFRWVMLPRS